MWAPTRLACAVLFLTALIFARPGVRAELKGAHNPKEKDAEMNVLTCLLVARDGMPMIEVFLPSAAGVENNE
jgi:hypothetical protein